MAEFGTLLRAWRHRLTPADAGLVAGDGRRLAGLRREEVATLADLSVDYVIRLEQGRAGHPSASAVAALAAALRLAEPEREQFYAAAGLPAPLPARIPAKIPASVRRLLGRIPDAAVAVYTAHWTLLTANAAWEALLGPPAPERNLVMQQFTGTAPDPIRDPADTERFERALVTDLRAAAIRYPHDPSLRALLAGLRAASDRFTAMWDDGTVATHRSGAKTFDHALVGRITVDCDTFTVAGADLQVVTYMAIPGTDDQARFDRLRRG